MKHKWYEFEKDIETETLRARVFECDGFYSIFIETRDRIYNFESETLCTAIEYVTRLGYVRTR